jgi:hypothetical protein
VRDTYVNQIAAKLYDKLISTGCDQAVLTQCVLFIYTLFILLLIFSGESGAGKSTCMQQLTIALAECAPKAKVV